jgi:hypothetical protein
MIFSYSAGMLSACVGLHYFEELVNEPVGAAGVYPLVERPGLAVKRA